MMGNQGPPLKRTKQIALLRYSREAIVEKTPEVYGKEIHLNISEPALEGQRSLGEIL